MPTPGVSPHTLFVLEETVLRNFGKRTILGLGLAMALGLSGMAMERPSPQQIEQYRQDGSLAARQTFAYRMGNHLIDPYVAWDAQKRLNHLMGLDNQLFTLPPGERRMPTKGTVKVLVICIEFSDMAHNSSDTTSAIQSRIFSTANTGLTGFYKTSSYNQLNIQGTVLGWYNTGQPRSSVPQTDAGRETLIKNALSSYDSTVNFSEFDNDGDGKIDYFAVIWTGADNGWGNFWWGYQTGFSDTDFKLDGKSLGTYSWQWESDSYPSGTFSPTVMIHETGHALGLPDYYDYDTNSGPDGGVGYDQMDDNTGDHNCFSKFLLDWITPTVKTGAATGVSLRPSGTYPDAMIFAPTWDPSQTFREFHMVQNRHRTGLDSGTMPTDGYVVWHVDARTTSDGNYFAWDNSYSSHKLLKRIEADGGEHIEAGSGASSADWFKSGSKLNPAAAPNSCYYQTGPTGMGLQNFVTTTTTAGSVDVTVSTDTTAPTGTCNKPTLAAGSTTGSMKVTWTKGTEADTESGIAGYILQIGTTAGGSDIYSGFSAALTQQIPELENGKSYYARIAAINGNKLVGPYSANSSAYTVSAPTLSGSAAEAPTLTFTNPSTNKWAVDSTGGQTGGTSLKSGTIGDSASSVIYTTVSATGNTNLSFYWKVSSEATFDFLTVWVDGVIVDGISGEVAWTKKTIALTPGNHRIKFAYIKDGGANAGQDAGWIDNISITSGALVGDLNHDGAINASDLSILAAYLTSATLPTGTTTTDCDIVADSSVDSLDLCNLLNRVVGNITF